MRLAVIVGALALSACQTPIRVDSFPTLGITVIRADAAVVDDNCRRRISVNDAGEPVTRRLRCCWMAPAMLVAFGDESCIPHELCHAEGEPPAVCAEVP